MGIVVDSLLRVVRHLMWYLVLECFCLHLTFPSLCPSLWRVWSATSWLTSTSCDVATLFSHYTYMKPGDGIDRESGTLCVLKQFIGVKLFHAFVVVFNKISTNILFTSGPFWLQSCFSQSGTLFPRRKLAWDWYHPVHFSKLALLIFLQCVLSNSN